MIQFEDDSGRILRKDESDDDFSLAEFTLRDEPDTESMRKLASESDFKFDGGNEYTAEPP